MSALRPQANRPTLLHLQPLCMSDGLPPILDYFISNRLLQTPAASSLPFPGNGIGGWVVGGQEGGGRQRRRPLGLSNLGLPWGYDGGMDGAKEAFPFQKSKSKQAVGAWASPLPNLGLSFPICRMGLDDELSEDPSNSKGH